jgi:hypothetical protein
MACCSADSALLLEELLFAPSVLGDDPTGSPDGCASGRGLLPQAANIKPLATISTSCATRTYIS